jgi:hypothetical protein
MDLPVMQAAVMAAEDAKTPHPYISKGMALKSVIPFCQHSHCPYNGLYKLHKIQGVNDSVNLSQLDTAIKLTFNWPTEYMNRKTDKFAFCELAPT